MNKVRSRQFEVIVGIDMETDMGSFATNYKGVGYGTPALLSVKSTYEK